jgi:putative toxin-antitoxin system antitoxin component (TIGR02293 family)
MTNASTRAAQLLGGTRVFHQRLTNPVDWISAIRKGFPASALDSLGRTVNATNAECALMLGISVRALTWRRNKGTLTHNESERLFRVARVIARSEDVFVDLANGFVWLKDPNISLGGVMPISLLDTETGAEMVMDVLGRIEHGVVA